MKKLLATVMALVLALTLLPTAALATEPAGNTTSDTGLVDAIEAFLESASEDKHTMTVYDGWQDATPVYWKVTDSSATTTSGFGATLKDALTAAYKANTNGEGEITIVCKPNANVGEMTHGHVADNLTIYGNNAYLIGGECDLEVDTYQYSRSTGAEDKTTGKYLEKDITITAYELDNLGVWGERKTAHTININLIDCDATDAKVNQRVYLDGTANNTAKTNITLTGCDFDTSSICPVKSDADGEITITNCSFDGVDVPINLKHDGTGTATYTVTNCRFTNCGYDNGSNNDYRDYAAPIRFVNGSGGKGQPINATVENCSFSGTRGDNGDILVGDGRNDKKNDYNINLTVTKAGSNTTVMAQKGGYYGGNKTVDDSAKGRAIQLTQGTSLTTSWDEMFTTPTVTFNSNGGSNVTAEEVNYYATAAKPNDPTKTGYTFNGWYTADGGAWNAGAPVTKNITLFADWTKDGETGGTGGTTKFETDEDGTVTKTVTNETNDGTTTTKVETKTTTDTNGTTTETETKTVTTEAATTKIETKTNGTAAATEATVTVETANAEKVKNKAITLDATVANKNAAEALTTVEVSVPKAAADSLKTAKSVEVVTDVGTLTINSTALKTITKDVTSADDKLTLVVEKTSEGTTSTQTTTTTTATYVLTAMVNNAPIFEETNKDKNGTITVTVPWTSAPGFRQQIVCYYVDGNTRTRMGGAGYKNNTFSWDTSHFSKFEVVSETVSNSRASINISGSSTGTTATTTTTTGKASSATTFDAGVGIYAVSAILSVTGMAWVGKKKH